MADVKQSLTDFLRSDSTLSDSTRNSARQTLRELIDDRIYWDRIPTRSNADVCLVLSCTGGQTYYAVATDTCLVTRAVDVDIYAKESVGVNAPVRLDEVWEALRKTISSYRGTWGTLTVQGCFIESLPVSAPVSPDDRSDNWTHRYFTSFDVTYVQDVPAD